MLDNRYAKIPKVLWVNKFDSSNADKLAKFFMSLAANEITLKVVENIINSIDTDIEKQTGLSLRSLSSLEEAAQKKLLKKFKILNQYIMHIQARIIAQRDKYPEENPFYEKYNKLLDDIKVLSTLDERIKYYFKPYLPRNEENYKDLLAKNIDHTFLEEIKEIKLYSAWREGEFQKAIVEKFDDFGKIAEDEVALAFDIKNISRSKKGEDFHAFAINHQEIPEVTKTIVDNLGTKNPIRFQVAIKIKGSVDIPDGHWAFGEFVITPSLEKPDVKILLCDPLGPSLSRNISEKFDESPYFSALRENANVRFYLATDMLQTRPVGCSYFAIDGARQLSNQENFQDVYKYMEKNGSTEGNVVTSSLPTRLLRAEQSMTSLKEKISSRKARNEIVNKKGQTFTQSLKQHTTSGGRKGHNVRILNKRKIIKEKVALHLDTIADADTYQAIIKNNRISGLKSYVSFIALEASMGNLSMNNDRAENRALIFSEKNIPSEKKETESSFKPKKSRRKDN